MYLKECVPTLCDSGIFHHLTCLQLIFEADCTLKYVQFPLSQHDCQEKMLRIDKISKQTTNSPIFSLYLSNVCKYTNMIVCRIGCVMHKIFNFYTQLCGYYLIYSLFIHFPLQNTIWMWFLFLRQPYCTFIEISFCNIWYWITKWDIMLSWNPFLTIRAFKHILLKLSYSSS